MKPTGFYWECAKCGHSGSYPAPHGVSAQVCAKCGKMETFKETYERIANHEFPQVDEEFLKDRRPLYALKVNNG